MKGSPPNNNRTNFWSCCPGFPVPKLWILIPLALLAVLSTAVSTSYSMAAKPSIPASGPLISPVDPPVSLSPPQPLKFNHLNIEDGLSQSSILAILQDRQGFMWFGTEDGLNRFDGHNFLVFKPDPGDPSSLSSRTILALAEDSQGNLWVGTQLGGLNRYNPQTGDFKRYLPDPQNPQSLSDATVCDLRVDANGIIWVATPMGLDRFDLESDAFIHYRHDPQNPSSLGHNHTHSLFSSPSGTLWVATVEGLDRMDPTTGTFTHYFPDPEKADSLPAVSITDLYETQDGILWIGTLDGLVQLDPSTDTFTHFYPDPPNMGSLSHNRIDAILEDHKGQLWVATRNGLAQFDRITNRFSTYLPEPGNLYSLSNAVLLSLYEDWEGILWVGTWGGGVNYLDPGRQKFIHYQNIVGDPNSLSENSVFQISEDSRNAIWIATYGGGLNQFDPLTGKFAHYRHDSENANSLMSDHLWAVYADNQGLVWVGSDLGLDFLNQATGEWTHYRPSSEPGSLGGRPVFMIIEDHMGSLWLGTGNGLARFDRQSGTFNHFVHDPDDPSSLGSDYVLTLYETPDGILWVGTNNGLDRMDSKSETFLHYRSDSNNPNSLSSDVVLAIHQDRNGILWIATGGGLNHYMPETDNFMRYTEANGLPNDVVYAIVEDRQGFLWLSTNNGISRFTPRTGAFENFDVGDGLQSREFNMNAYCLTRSGKIVFGGVHGINIFDPDQVASNQYIPPVVLTSLTQNGQTIPKLPQPETVQEFTLKWPANGFEFEFATLSYAEPQKNQYAYRLDNLEKDWTSLGNPRFGRYTNLPGGTYTLRMKGSNNDGFWNEEGALLKVTVIPPFWQTWWFRAVGLFLATVTVFGSYKLRVHNIQLHSHELERQVAERTREIECLFEQAKELAIIEERNRLARDLHDSAKQKAFAALAQLGAVRGILKKDPTTAQNHLEEAENLVYEVIQELTFLIQEMYPLALEEKGLPTTLREYIFEWENRNDIEVKLDVSGQRRLPLQIEQAVYRIIQEALANVARHSHATQVAINLAYLDSQLQVSVVDNGCGFDIHQKPNGVGLRSIRERAESVGGTLQIDTAPGQGTRISVQISVQI